MINPYREQLSTALDRLPKRFDPRIPMGRKSYFWTSMFVFIGNFAVYFIIYFLVILFLGDATPDYLTEESAPYPAWFSFFFLPFLIPVHLIDFRRAKAASIHYSWVWFLITLSVFDAFYFLNSPDFLSPIARLSGIVYLWFIFRKNRLEVPWPVQADHLPKEGDISKVKQEAKINDSLDEDTKYITNRLSDLEKSVIDLNKTTRDD